VVEPAGVCALRRLVDVGQGGGHAGEERLAVSTFAPIPSKPDMDRTKPALLN
jgi:hypothetical protein